MRDYDEHFECFDDSVCYHCNHKLPADIEDGSPQDKGFCSMLCETNSELGIEAPINGEMAELLTSMLGRDTPEGWDKSVYKGTACGAWMKTSPFSVDIGSIVEGSDVEIAPIELVWPFTEEEFLAVLEDIDKEAQFYWERDNSEWFWVTFSPVDKPAERFHGRHCWGVGSDTGIEWASDEVPHYVKNKVEDWFLKTDDFTDYDVPKGIALGISLTIYCNDMEYR
jgi:hypothetical protein